MLNLAAAEDMARYHEEIMNNGTQRRYLYIKVVIIIDEGTQSEEVRAGDLQ